MVSRILNSQSKNITSAAFVLGVTTLISKILGLLRDRLLAGQFGAGNELDAYYAAFRIPDFIFNILVIGAISSAFIPVFANLWARDEKEAWRVANGVFNIFLSALILISAVFILFCPLLISLVAPGFEGEKKELTVLLTRLMFFSPIFLAVSNIFSGILQYFHRFVVYSLAPIFYNLGIILGIVFLSPKFGIIGVAWGVVLGAFLHMAIQIPAVRFCGYRYQIFFDIHHPGIRKIIKLMIPRTIGLGASQLNLIIITAIASTLASGSIAIFNLSNNLQYIPVGLVGISFATAIFPSLSKDFVGERKKEFVHKFSSVFRQILFLVVPMSFLVFILRAQIVRIILGTGQFGWADTRLTAACLGLFSLGIFAQAFLPLVSKAFYALHNTVTPVVVSVLSIIINIILSLILVWSLSFDNCFFRLISESLKLEGISQISIVALALAFSVSSLFNFFLLIFALYKKLGEIDFKNIIGYAAKVLLSSFLMTEVVYFGLYIFAQAVDMKTFFGIFLQSGGAAFAGIITYLFAARFLNLYKFGKIKDIIRPY